MIKYILSAISWFVRILHKLLHNMCTGQTREAQWGIKFAWSRITILSITLPCQGPAFDREAGVQGWPVIIMGTLRIDKANLMPCIWVAVGNLQIEMNNPYEQLRKAKAKICF